MRDHNYMGIALAGLGAGAVAGLFGGGGGLVLIPLLRLLTDMEEDTLFPVSVAVMLPVCATAAVVTALSGGLDGKAAVPYLLGGGIGGYLAGRWGGGIPTVWLHRFLGAMVLWGGIRYLC